LILVAGTGASSYFGELKNPKDYIDAKPNVNLGLSFYLTNRISVRTEATWFQLKGDDAKADDGSRRRRNLSFSSNNFELNATGAINLYPNGNRYYRRPGFNLYGFAGLGLIYFNPTTQYNGKTTALAPLKTENVSYSRVALVIPFGLGVRLRTGPNTNICFEGGYRKTFTDYLDDVSTVYPDPATLGSQAAIDLSNRYVDNDGNPDPGRATPGMQRGDAGKKDGYFLLNIKLEYYLSYSGFMAGGRGLQGKKGGFNRKRNSSMYRYRKSGRLRR